MVNGSQNSGKPGVNPEAKSAPTVMVVDLAAHEKGAKEGAFSTRSLGDIVRGNTLAVVTPPPQLKDAEPLTTSIIASIRAHVKEHGTIPELRFGGHGSSNRLFFGADNVRLYTDELINGIHALQKELGIKIADKVTFQGCNTFTEMSPEWVDYYRKMSKKLGTELIGTTNFLAKSPITGFESLPYISFKNGEVGKFTLDVSPVMAAFEIGTIPLKKTFDALIMGRAPIRDNWTQCHTGRSQEEGAACQKSNEKLEVATAKVDEWLTAPARFVRKQINDLTKQEDKGQTR
jgi:hypothetical protein